MERKEIVARFLLRFAQQGFPPGLFPGAHDSARHKDAIISQPANQLYLDCGSDMQEMEIVLHFCILQGWIVEPFGLSLGLGVNQNTFEATQAGLDAGMKILEALNERHYEQG